MAYTEGNVTTSDKQMAPLRMSREGEKGRKRGVEREWES